MCPKIYRKSVLHLIKQSVILKGMQYRFAVNFGTQSILFQIFIAYIRLFYKIKYTFIEIFKEEEKWVMWKSYETKIIHKRIGKNLLYVCPRSPVCMASYYLKWVMTSWTDSR